MYHLRVSVFSNPVKVYNAINRRGDDDFETAVSMGNIPRKAWQNQASRSLRTKLDLRNDSSTPSESGNLVCGGRKSGHTRPLRPNLEISSVHGREKQTESSTPSESGNSRLFTVEKTDKTTDH